MFFVARCCLDLVLRCFVDVRLGPSACRFFCPFEMFWSALFRFLVPIFAHLFFWDTFSFGGFVFSILARRDCLFTGFSGKGPTVPAPFQLSKSNRSDKAPGSAPGTPRSREETLTFRESLARIENKVGRWKAFAFLLINFVSF